VAQHVASQPLRERATRQIGAVCAVEEGTDAISGNRSGDEIDQQQASVEICAHLMALYYTVESRVIRRSRNCGGRSCSTDPDSGKDYNLFDPSQYPSRCRYIRRSSTPIIS
jgi:hypothetical protein